MFFDSFQFFPMYPKTMSSIFQYYSVFPPVFCCFSVVFSLSQHFPIFPSIMFYIFHHFPPFSRSTSANISETKADSLLYVKEKVVQNIVLYNTFQNP